MSGGGNDTDGGIMKDYNGYLSGFYSGGSYNTNGTGWAQGGNFQDGIDGGFMKRMKHKNDVKVPKAGTRPEWMLGENGQLRSDLQLGNPMPKSFNQSQDVLDSLSKNAMATGPSQSAQYLQAQNDRNTQNSLGQADAINASGMAAMKNNMAMRGGLDAGARERMGKAGGLDNIMNKQKILNDSAGNNLDILSKDEANKQDVLKALPASLLAQAGLQQSGKQFDISNTLGVMGNKYDKDMSEWGNRQAAIEQAQIANKNNTIFGLGIGPL